MGIKQKTLIYETDVDVVLIGLSVDTKAEHNEFAKLKLSWIDRLCWKHLHLLSA